MSFYCAGIGFCVLGYAAWTDRNEGQIDDWVSLVLMLCAPSVMDIARGVMLGGVFAFVARYTQRLGSADPVLLGSLCAALSLGHFLAVCVGATISLAAQGRYCEPQPLAWHLWIAYSLSLAIISLGEK